MAKDDEWLHEADGYEPPSRIRITHVERDVERRPAERCAEMLALSMHATSKTTKKNYLAAACWFALASEGL